MFSTITTVASTIMPMLMARPPSDMRLADNPSYHIRMKATSMQKGIAAAVMNELRKLPSSSTKMISTNSSPSISDSTTVCTLLSTSSRRTENMGSQIGVSLHFGQEVDM